MKDMLTAEDIKNAMALLKMDVPIYNDIVVKHSYYDELRKKVVLEDRPFDFFGTKVYIKNQVAAAWMIADKEITNKYLSDELSELDMIHLAFESKKVVPILP